MLARRGLDLDEALAGGLDLELDGAVFLAAFGAMYSSLPSRRSRLNAPTAMTKGMPSRSLPISDSSTRP